MMKPKLKSIIRILVGLIFIVSAIFKLQSIDSFEIYVYSFGIVNLNTAFLAARLIIAFELLLGLMLGLGIYAKKAISVSALMLIGFSVFILYLLLSNQTEHCHCFGDAIELSHSNSLIKNMVLIALLAFSYIKAKPSRKKKYEKYFFLGLTIISLTLTFIISPPDSFQFETYAKKTSYNAEALRTYLEKGEHEDKTEVIAFFGSGCRFCKLAAKKLAVIAKKTASDSSINYVFWGTEEKIKQFIEENNPKISQYSSMHVGEFLRLTDGNMPVILLLENGVVKKKYGYRDINESEIVDFLTKNK